MGDDQQNSRQWFPHEGRQGTVWGGAQRARGLASCVLSSGWVGETMGIYLLCVIEYIK